MWKDVSGYEGLYQVSEDGQVKSLGRTTYGGCRGGMCLKRYPSKILAPVTGGKRMRARVNLHKMTNGGKVQRKTFYIIDLVRAAWGDVAAAKLPGLQKQKPGRKPSLHPATCRSLFLC